MKLFAISVNIIAYKRMHSDHENKHWKTHNFDFDFVMEALKSDLHSARTPKSKLIKSSKLKIDN